MIPAKRNREPESLIQDINKQNSPPKKKKAANKCPTEADWVAHKDVLRDYYFDSDLPKLMVHMREVYGFVASKTQYQTRFKMWNFRKNFTAEERKYILHQKRKRDEAGKETRVVLHGIEIPNKRLEKEKNRYSLSDLKNIFSSCTSAPSPEGISVATPPCAVDEYTMRGFRIDNLPSFNLKSLFSNLSFLYRPSPLRNHESSTPMTRVVPDSVAPLLRSSNSNDSTTPTWQNRMIRIFGNRRNLFGNPTLSCVETHELLVQQIRNGTLEKYSEEAEARTNRLLGSSEPESLQEFMIFVAQFGSNNMLEPQQSEGILEWMAEQNEGMISALFDIQDKVVQECLDGLVPAAIHGHNRNKNRSYFKALMTADKYQRLYHGRREKLLLAAVELDLVEIVERLVGEGINVNTEVSRRNPIGEWVPSTLLGAASSVQAARVLIKAGADINALSYKYGREEEQNKEKRVEVVVEEEEEDDDEDEEEEEEEEDCDVYAPVYYAACDGNGGLFRLFLDHGARFDSTDFGLSMPNRPESVLACAIEKGSIEVVKILVERGVECTDSLRTNWEDGLLLYQTELQRACSLGETEIVEVMLGTTSGRNVLRDGRYKWAPLRDAAMCGYTDIVNLLIGAGADVNAAARVSQSSIDDIVQTIPSTALMAAVEEGHVKVVERLLSCGARVNEVAVGTYGMNTLAVAEILQLHEIVTILRNAGAVAQRDKEQMRVDIQFAASRNDLSKVRGLLDIGIDASHILDARRCVFEKVGKYSELNLLSTFIEVCPGGIDARGPRTGTSVLELAIELGDLTLLQKLGQARADFNQTTSHGISPLQWALTTTEKPSLDLVVCLLKYGAAVDAPSVYSRSLGQRVYCPLEIAVVSTNHEIIERLLRADIKGTAASRSKTVMSDALFWCDLQTVELLLDHGANLDGGCFGEPPLHTAVSWGKIDAVRFLLDRGANVNERDGVQGLTALQTAAYNGRLDIVKLLLDSGAEINAPAIGEEGETALQAAIRNDHNIKPTNIDLVQLLIDKGADVNAPPCSDGGLTALQAAAGIGNLKIALMLLEKGADINAPGFGKDGLTALEAAAHYGRLDMVRLLLNAGAVPNQSAVNFAKREMHYMAADMIEEEMEGRGSGGKEVKAGSAERDGVEQRGGQEGTAEAMETMEDGVDWQWAVDWPE